MSWWKSRMAFKEIKAPPASKTTKWHQRHTLSCLSQISPCMLNASGVCTPKEVQRHLDTQIRNSRIHAPEGQMPLAVRGRDTEAGMLSGISRKRKIRSNLYWFTEFCNSQCLSHFAAPFIVVRAETSVAESCKQLFQWGSPPDDVTEVPKHW